MPRPELAEALGADRELADPRVAYAQSKAANVLFAVEATRRWADDGIVANAVHPGPILETGLARHMDHERLKALVESGAYTSKSAARGAATRSSQPPHR